MTRPSHADSLPIVCPECGEILKWAHPDAFVDGVQHWDDDHHYIGDFVDLSGGFTPIEFGTEEAP